MEDDELLLEPKEFGSFKFGPKGFKLGPEMIKLGSGIRHLTDECPYIRIGCNYYKIIEKTDRYGFKRKELKQWLKSEIVQDFGTDYPKTIPHYDDFIVEPSNIDFKQVVQNCYNIYSEFLHVAKQGNWIWTERLLKHVFGEQYELGLRYLQILYLHPDRSTVILALVSAERGTGKTTFLNWINALFGANMVIISSSDLLSNFNSHYATKNIVAIEESLFSQKQTVDKLKALATAKFIQVNQKFVTPYKIQCYVKIILTSNNEDDFAVVEANEIRFFVRKLGKPEFINHAIEDDLIKEIPAFLDFLKSLPKVDWTVSRSGFTTDELKNSSLDAVVRESKSDLYKDLIEHLINYFNNTDQEFIYAAPTDIKEKFFSNNNRVGINSIRRTLKNEFKMFPDDNHRYTPFQTAKSIVGRPYYFKRTDFVTKLSTETNDCYKVMD
ncbi:MAG: DUF5906 domain-containing protein [Bacteroidales bacterium]|nr:DUF5906 domain-containing protein [Bacteroidales bacterium]